MKDEMLVAQAEWLPQYSDAIPVAKVRLDAHVAAGTRVKTMGWLHSYALTLLLILSGIREVSTAEFRSC